MEELINKVSERASQLSQVESVATQYPDIEGVSVKFTAPVEDYDEACEILENEFGDEIDVTRYSNMTGEGGEHVIILVELGE